MTNRATNKLLLFLLIFSIVCVSNCFYISSSYAGTKITVSTAEELNGALGGGHEVEGNSLVLEHNVDLSDEIIRITETETELKLDLNGYNILKDVPEEETSFPVLFSVNNADFRLMGDGTLRINSGSSKYSNVISYEDGANVVIDGGTIEPDDNRAAIQNDGNAEYGSKASTLTINGGKIKGIIADSGRYSYGKYVINGGEINELAIPYAEQVTVNGGTIGNLNSGNITLNGGIIGKLRIEDGNWWKDSSKVKGGEITSGIVLAGQGITKLLGGTIYGGVKIEGMNYLLKEYPVRLVLDGSRVIYDTKLGTGIRVSGAARIKLISGEIYSTKTGRSSGKRARAGVYIEKQRKKGKDESKVYFQAAKDRKLKIKGFTSALYRESTKSKVAIKAHTKLTVKKYDSKKERLTNKNVKYVKGSKVPRFIRGNMTVSYR